MSQWKQIAMQKIRESGRNPDSKEFAEIRGAKTPMQMWVELFLSCIGEFMTADEVRDLRGAFVTTFVMTELTS